jgi:serralysin
MRARNGNIKFEATTGNDSFDFSALDRLNGPNGVGFGIDYINPGGRDRVVGTSFDDSFTLSAGAEIIDGASGVDTVIYQSSTSGVRVNLTATVQSGGFAEGDQLSGIENVTGSQNHADSLTGNSFANVLSGLGGNDTISGGGGNDIIIGGSGQDSVTGGSGADVFVFRDGDFLPVTTADGWTSYMPDGIRDFERGMDMIDLRGYDANTQIAGDQAFHVTTEFTNNAGELTVMRTYVSYRGDVTTTTDLWGGDTNGDGQADFSFSVSGAPSTLTPSDFLL